MKKPSEFLEDLADLLEGHWIQEQLELVDSSRMPIGWCLVGGMQRLTQESPAPLNMDADETNMLDEINGIERIRKALARKAIDFMNEEVAALDQDEENLFSYPNNPTAELRAIILFNDKPNTTEPVVLNMVRDTAKELRLEEEGIL